MSCLIQLNDPSSEIGRNHTEPGSKEALEAQHGKIWTTKELGDDFEVIGFMAPFVVVRRRVDGVEGSLEFQEPAQVYFNFQQHED